MPWTFKPLIDTFHIRRHEGADVRIYIHMDRRFCQNQNFLDATMEDKRTWDCVKSPSKQLLCTTLLLRTIFCSALGSSRRPPTSPSNVVAKKSPHFHPFCSKSNFVWGGRGGVASFSHITGKVPTLLTSIV